jgi:RimJ/RimL family protein N-acetyltransferase
MTDFDGAYRYLESERLRLVAASTSLVQKDLAGPDQLALGLGVSVPDNWPPELYDRRAMQYAAQQLADFREHRWSFWYLVSRRAEEEVLVGICGFRGSPDAGGSVELGYSILSQFRNQGFATEAVGRLLAWAFSHGAIMEVSAETFPHLTQSIRVLEKNGFTLTGKGSERGVVRYAVQRSNLN